jgi:hypothetical protein
MAMLKKFKLFFVTAALNVNCASSDKSQELQAMLNSNYLSTQKKAKEALAFCKQNQYNTEFCILIDMKQHSGLNRFYMWSFAEDTVLFSFPVSHGCGNAPWSSDFTKETPSFSNEDGSHKSSLGKYKIGARGYSNWGVHVKYLLHGLESTNNNALKRTIVFHSWEAVSDDAIYPDGTAEGWGCPAISNNNFNKIDPMLSASKQPVLMWIYQ